MFELTKEEIKFLLNEYDVTKRAVKLIALTFSNYGFIKTKEEYLLLCEAACYRYQSGMVDNEYYHSIDEKGHRINMSDVIINALEEVYEEPEDMNYADKMELENAKIRLLTDNTTH